MKRGLINEDIQKMMNLINYNRGKTLTENRQTNNRQQLNEFVTPAHLAAAGLGFLLSGPLKSLGNTLLSSAKSAGQTMMTLLGRSANSPAVNAILNSTSYNKFFVALNKLEEEFGVRKGFLSRVFVFFVCVISLKLSAAHILVIESYHAQYPWDIEYKKALVDTLGTEHSFSYFEMDTKRLAKSLHQQRAELAWQEYIAIKPYIVVLCEDNGFR